MFYVPTTIWFVVAWLFFGYLAAAIMKYDFVKTYPKWGGSDMILSLLIIFCGPVVLVFISLGCFLSHKKIGIHPNIFKRIIKR